MYFSRYDFAYTRSDSVSLSIDVKPHKKFYNSMIQSLDWSMELEAWPHTHTHTPKSLHL